MAINSSRDWLAYVAENGETYIDHLHVGNNLQLPPDSYTPDWDTGRYDSVTFAGTPGTDTLIGGGARSPPSSSALPATTSTA